jgi:16S rRNA (cytidine1402-2'-O)-methyltransferase
MPGLSDPGYELVRAALERDIRVVPIPGASAVLAALVASGLPTDQFVYLGFLPRQKSARRKFLHAIADEPRTLVMFEAPHRVCASLDDIWETLGDRAMCVARELTKLYEEFVRGTVSQARAAYRPLASSTGSRGSTTWLTAEQKSRMNGSNWNSKIPSS